MLLVITMVTTFSVPVYSASSPAESAPDPAPRVERWWDEYDAQAYLDENEVQAESARLWVFEDPEHPEGWNTGSKTGFAAQSQNSAGAELAKFVGTAVLKGVANKGIGFGFDLLLSEMFGFGNEDQYGQALRDIQASLDQLESQMNAVLDGIKAVMDQATRIDFEQRQQLVAAEASTIRYHLQQVTDWIDQGYQPSQSTVENVASSTELALARLQGLLNDAAGGTVPALLKAASTEDAASTLENYWIEVQYYFDTYKATVAQGLIVLDALVEWDTTGDVEMTLTTASAFVLQTVEGMYRLSGVPYLQAEGKPKYLHAKYEPNVFTSAGRPTLPGDNTWEPVIGYDALEGQIGPLRAAYNPNVHGLTLEEYMRTNDLRVDFLMLDNDYIATWYEIVNLSTGYNYYQHRYQVLEIRGNDYSYPWVHGTAYTYYGQASWERNYIYDSLNNSPQAWKMDVELNAGGRAASFDENFLHSAVIGIDGFEVVDNEPDAVTVSLDNPTLVYPHLRFIDDATGEVFASTDSSQGIQSFSIPANGATERLIRVEQGYVDDEQFFPRAQSAFVTDSGSDTWVQVWNNGIVIKTVGDGTVSMFTPEGNNEYLYYCEEVATCNAVVPAGTSIFIISHPGEFSEGAGIEGPCAPGWNGPTFCAFEFQPGVTDKFTAFFEAS